MSHLRGNRGRSLPVPLGEGLEVTHHQTKDGPPGREWREIVKEMYERLGIDPTNLGCAMLDVESIRHLVKDVPQGLWYPEEDGWAGPVRSPHITLLHGLLKSAHEWRWAIGEVLGAWVPPQKVRLAGYRVFGNATDPYDTVVGWIDDGAEDLREANLLLSQLPHIRTFPYTPRVTIGRVLKGTGRYVVSDLSKSQYGKTFLSTGALNFGGEE